MQAELQFQIFMEFIIDTNNSIYGWKWPPTLKNGMINGIVP